MKNILITILQTLILIITTPFIMIFGAISVAYIIWQNTFSKDPKVLMV